MTAITAHPSPNHGHRPDGARIDMIVLHYTGMVDAASARARLCDPQAEVSSHYLVEEDGRILALVAEHRRAWHAGVSCWAGARDINDRSIGIEIVNPGHEWGYRPFPPAQIEAVVRLCRDVMGRHGIAPARVVGHSDVAPARKQDPGELFPWSDLAARGVGLFPPDGLAPAPIPNDIGAALGRYGYCGDDLPAAILAFQRHFQPLALRRPFDADGAARLAWLIAAGQAGDASC